MGRTKRKKQWMPPGKKTTGLELEPPDGGWGWLVALGSFIEMFLTMGTLLCSGVYFTPLQNEFELSAAELGWIISSGSTLLSATCPIGSACVKRFGCRVTSLIGGVATSCGFIASAFAQSGIHIFVTLGLISGIGAGLVFVSAAVILGHYFKRRYAVVNGLAFSGPGVAIFVLPPVLDYLIETYGWRGSFLIQGGIGMHIIAAAALFRPLTSELNCYGDKQNGKSYTRIEMDEIENKRHSLLESEPEVEEHQQADLGDSNLVNNHDGTVHLESVCVAFETTSSGTQESTCKGSQSLSKFTDISVHKEEIETDICNNTTSDIVIGEQISGESEEMLDESKGQSETSKRFSSDRLSFKNNAWLLYMAAFVLVCPVSFFQACAFYSVTSHVVARTALVGVSAQMAGMTLSSLGAGSAFTRLTHGWFIQRGLVTATTAYILALITGAIGAFANAVSQTYIGVIIASLIIGFSSGSVYPLVPVVLRDLVSLRGLPTTYGLAMFFDSCGVFAGGFTAGVLRDVTGTYTASFCVTGAYYSLATLFLLFVPAILRVHHGREHADRNAEPKRRQENEGC